MEDNGSTGEESEKKNQTDFPANEAKILAAETFEPTGRMWGTLWRFFMVYGPGLPGGPKWATF